MELRDYLAALRRHWAIWVGATLAGALLAVGVFALTPKTYEASATVFVSVSPSIPNSASFVQQRVKSYPEIVTSEAVLAPVHDALELDGSLADLRSRVSATNPADTTQLHVTVSGSDPDEARGDRQRGRRPVRRRRGDPGDPVDRRRAGAPHRCRPRHDPRLAGLAGAALPARAGRRRRTAARRGRGGRAQPHGQPPPQRRRPAPHVGYGRRHRGARPALRPGPPQRADRGGRDPAGPPARTARRGAARPASSCSPRRLPRSRSPARSPSRSPRRWWPRRGRRGHRPGVPADDDLGGGPRVRLAVADPLESLRFWKQVAARDDGVVLVVAGGRVDSGELLETRRILRSAGITPLAIALVPRGAGRQRGPDDAPGGRPAARRRARSTPRPPRRPASGPPERVRARLTRRTTRRRRAGRDTRPGRPVVVPACVDRAVSRLGRVRRLPPGWPGQHRDLDRERVARLGRPTPLSGPPSAGRPRRRRISSRTVERAPESGSVPRQVTRLGCAHVSLRAAYITAYRVYATSAESLRRSCLSIIAAIPDPQTPARLARALAGRILDRRRGHRAGPGRMALGGHHLPWVFPGRTAGVLAATLQATTSTYSVIALSRSGPLRATRGSASLQGRPQRTVDFADYDDVGRTVVPRDVLQASRRVGRGSPASNTTRDPCVVVPTPCPGPRHKLDPVLRPL